MKSIRKTFGIGFTAILLLSTTYAFAQHSTQRSQLDSSWIVVYDIPATQQVKVRTDVPYLRGAGGTLTVDIYTPPDLKTGERRPAVVFINGIGDDGPNKLKNWGIYKSWPRLVAAHGMVGVSMEADGARIQDCLRGVFDFLIKQGVEYGIDGSRLSLYAASANVRATSQYLASAVVAKEIRAAVLYYGQPTSDTLRANLPVLFIVAESDVRGMGQPLLALWQRVVEAKAPWFLLFAKGLPHGFDAFSDNDDARRIIQQTISFWRSHLESVPQPSWPPSIAREITGATYWGDQQKVVDLLTNWTKENPSDISAYIKYGTALTQLRRWDEAAAALEKALSLGSTSGNIFFNLSKIRYNQGQSEQGGQFLSRAINAGIPAGYAYSQIGSLLLGKGLNEDAVKHYEKAFEAGDIFSGMRGPTCYNLACGYTRLGKKDKAFEALTNAISEGFGSRRTYETDEDLAPLRSDARFQEILSRLPNQ